MSTRRTDPQLGRPKAPLHPLPTYWERSQWPLQALLFLLPLLVVYELGTVMFAPEGSDRLPAILAESLLGDAFEWVGVTGVYLPGFLVVAVLLAWHVVRRDPWTAEPKLYLGMLAESLLLMLPLLVLSLVLSRERGGGPGPEASAAWALAGNDISQSFGLGERIIFSIGAGIYEELVFRLIAIALLHMLLVDLLALPERWGALAAVGLSALAFALYHFQGFVPWHWPTLRADFDAGRFAFYMIAGLYFAGVYVARGFGIVAVVHALYDIVVLSAQHGLGDGG